MTLFLLTHSRLDRRLLLCALVMLAAQAIPVPVLSMGVVETVEGSVLIGAKRSAGEIAQGPEAWSRDPFNWPMHSGFELEAVRSIPASPLPAMTLTGILWDEDSPHVIIDDTLLTAGEYMHGARITEILEDRVLLEWKREVHTLKFAEIYDLETLPLSPLGAPE